MFERFTERARQVVILAQEEARTNKQGYIGPEHILVGLLREGEGIPARVLASLDVTVEKTRSLLIGEAKGPIQEDLPHQIPFTPRAKKALELALREALSLGHNYIGTEHVLLGLLREGQNLAVAILEKDFGLTTEKVRGEVIRVLSKPEKVKVPGALASLAADERERRDARARQEVQRLEDYKKSDELLELLDTAIMLGRQYPDRPSRAVAIAARELHS
jgi:ATP-dependent Clp protease ATP-binding subunit ClpC